MVSEHFGLVGSSVCGGLGCFLSVLGMYEVVFGMVLSLSDRLPSVQSWCPVSLDLMVELPGFGWLLLFEQFVVEIPSHWLLYCNNSASFVWITGLRLLPPKLFPKNRGSKNPEDASADSSSASRSALTLFFGNSGWQADGQSSGQMSSWVQLPFAKWNRVESRNSQISDTSVFWGLFGIKATKAEKMHEKLRYYSGKFYIN